MSPAGRFAAEVAAYAQDLQSRIIRALEAVDGGRFDVTPWDRPEGGGGRMAILRGTRLEKAGVLWSGVWGPRNPVDGRPFFATGTSVIVHPLNPKAPAAHLNVRYFEVTGTPGEPPARPYHVGGGMDLTPMAFPFTEDRDHFHRVCAEAAGDRYPAFKAAADSYFFVKHRGRARGEGGLFFDQLSTGDPPRDLALVRSVGDRFLDAYLPVLKRRLDEPWTEADREAQLRARAVYAEFNLAYDRGTRFGFESGGNVEAILASMPPVVKW